MFPEKTLLSILLTSDLRYVTTTAPYCCRHLVSIDSYFKLAKVSSMEVAHWESRMTYKCLQDAIINKILFSIYFSRLFKISLWQIFLEYCDNTILRLYRPTLFSGSNLRLQNSSKPAIDLLEESTFLPSCRYLQDQSNLCVNQPQGFPIQVMLNPRAKTQGW